MTAIHTPTHLELSIDITLPQGHCQYHETIALQAGIIGIFGASGQGKTTLMSLLSGHIPLPNKAVHYQGISDKLLSNIVTHCAVYQAQTPHLFTAFTVKENLLLVQRHARLPSLFTMADVIDWCGISHLLEQSVMTLSGGEKQRVALARSLLCGKSVLLLDEPFSAIDDAGRRELLDILLHLQVEHEFRIILVSHSLKDLAYVSCDILLIEKHHVTQRGTAEQIRERLSAVVDIPASNYLLLKQITNTRPHKWVIPVQDPTQHAELPIGWMNEAPIMSSINDSTTYRWYISAHDIGLSATPLTESSLLNIIPVQIVRCTEHSDWVDITLTVNGQTLLMQLSQAQWQACDLSTAQQAYALLPNRLTN